MSTENQDFDLREGGRRIEDLPLSDSQLTSQERDRPSPLRAPPASPLDNVPPEGGRGLPPPDPGDPEDARQSPPPAEPEE